jgi:hypothetical protein
MYGDENPVTESVDFDTTFKNPCLDPAYFDFADEDIL